MLENNRKVKYLHSFKWWRKGATGAISRCGMSCRSLLHPTWKGPFYTTYLEQVTCVKCLEIIKRDLFHD